MKKLLENIYGIIGMICFAWFTGMLLKTGIPHLPALMFAMYFSILFKLEQK